ncbi:protein kinase domain-containing protein [Alteromonas sp. A081]|uniref:protein kinase domain-containing protein n=1 Tax=Alteromonas sp. A081 TaxID=3410269 RepID=UPI003B981ABA
MASGQTKKRIVTDTFGQDFELVKKIGHGGQGVVCTTQVDNVLVKMSTQPDKNKKRKWLEHVHWLMRQPLEQLNIAKPFSRIAMKGNNFGYAMELMDGLISLESLMNETEELIAEEGSPEHYLATGGLKRRMTILAKLARILSDLHARGLAYGDLSPANIFVSENADYSEVWLIDCDNICINQRESFDSIEQEGQAGRIFSPGFGAPEVVNGDSLVSSITDAWSFAVVAMKLLTTNHPFVGEAVENGTPEDEERAFSGELPWIYHPTDNSNALDKDYPKGIPLELVALKPLYKLFEQCFNVGKEDPLARPSLSEWAEVLEQLAHTLVKCQNNVCNASFNFLVNEGQLECPFCSSTMNNSQVLYIRNNLQDLSILELPDTTINDTYVDTGYNQTLNIGETIVIKNSSPGSMYWPESQELLSIHFSKEGLEITPIGAKSFEMGMGKNKLQTFNSKTPIAASTRANRWLIIVPIVDTPEPQIANLFRLRW